MGSSMYNFGGYDPNNDVYYGEGSGMWQQNFQDSDGNGVDDRRRGQPGAKPVPQFSSNPYGMWGGGFPQMQQQPATQEFDFQGMFDNLFSKYFPQQQQPTTPATPEQPVVAAPKPAFGKNFGKSYMTTGHFNQAGRKQIKKAGYAGVRDFKTKNQNFGFDYNANHPGATPSTPTPYLGPTPPVA